MFALTTSTVAAQEGATAPDGSPTPLASSTPDARPKEQVITLRPRLSQFYQGLATGDSGIGAAYGGKLDLLVNADLSKLGLWNGFSVTVQAEYNFGSNANGRGGVGVPIDTALAFPAMNSVDLSSVFLGQKFGNSVSLLVGKINIIDLAAGAPFKGGAGIDSFWNITFAAPPSGTVPPYLLGALLNVRTKGPSYNLWIYDPQSQVNKSALQNPFSQGVTVRANVDFPVTIGQRGGHQGVVATFSNQPGTDLSTLGDEFLPPSVLATPGTKNFRHYFAYTFDQFLVQSKTDPKQGIGLFGQFGISDGNPNKLYWSALVGVGGTGLIAGRSRDNWGAGFYRDSLSNYVKPLLPLYRDEQGAELFYNFAVDKHLTLGTDLQIISPALGATTVIAPGLRAILKF